MYELIYLFIAMQHADKQTLFSKQRIVKLVPAETIQSIVRQPHMTTTKG